MVKRAKNFDELYKNRLKWVETSEDNGFNEGILKLLTELYPDKAHFVYELLQNAEDAKATSVSFQLYPDRLEFIHNGSRLFSLDDIDSITSIANTTKTKEDHTIGKFGVGFKAVFSYTQTPQIRSGDWNFEIRRLVIPAPLEPIKDIDKEKTYFTFPFNNPKKTPEKAYIETKIGLEKLPPETLLFLNNIQELTWTIKDEEHKISKKEQDHIVSLYVDDNTKPIVQYLRFTKNNITLETSNGITEHLSVALAYKLEEDGDKKLKIVPISPSEHNVFIYFPAEKEDSELRFLINAPFDSEVSRASIRDTDDNALLIKEIVGLQIETMEYLRDNGYITTDFLGVLPNSKDQLSEMYQVFHKKLVDLFKNEDFTPTMSGEFRPARGLYKGSLMYKNGPHIAEFISDEELHKIVRAQRLDLYGDHNYDINAEDNSICAKTLWVKNTLQNSLADYFLQDLDLNGFGVEKFYNWLLWMKYRGNKKRIWIKIIDKKEFSDLVKLYRMLYQYFEEHADTVYGISSCPLFRCIDGKMYSNDDEVYILPEDDIPEDIMNSYHFIDKKSFGNIKQLDYVRNLFINYFNIEVFSAETIEREKLHGLLNKYSSENLTTTDVSIKQHITDIKFILKLYMNTEYREIIKDKLSLRHYFILSMDNKYRGINYVYSDTRYGNEHDLMSELYSNSCAISDIYREKLTEKQLMVFINLLDDLGIKKFLQLEKQGVNCRDHDYYLLRGRENIRNTKKEYDADFNCDFLSLIDCMRKNRIISKLIWISILKIDTHEFPTKAFFMANMRDDMRYAPASYIYRLVENAWILDKNGYLQKPEDMTFENLPNDWEKPKEGYKHPILEAIGFGKNNQELREEQLKRDKIAQEDGFKNAKEAKDAKEFYNEFTDEERQDLLQRKRNKTLPESASINPERRQVKVSDEYENASEQVYETKERSVRVSDTQVRKDARQYLTDMYTDEDGKMCCQMCQEELPFKKKDDQYCFETKEIFNKMEKEDKHQYLALCPNCAAEYDEWVKKDEKTSEMLKNKIAERKYIKGEKSVSMDFYIHKDLKTLYFTGKHYLDLRTVVCPDADIDKNQSFWASLGGNVVIPLEIGDTVRSEHFGEGIVCSIGSNAFGPTADVDFSEGRKTINIERLEKKIS